jgi:hypothetical protein
VFLNRSVNANFIQSVYTKGLPSSPKLPVFHGTQIGYNYDQPLHPCTINSFTSTFQNTVGPIPLIQNYPVFCVFTLQRSSNVTSCNTLDVNQ